MIPPSCRTTNIFCLTAQIGDGAFGGIQIFGKKPAFVLKTNGDNWETFGT